jgi:hypothetical protein
VIHIDQVAENTDPNVPQILVLDLRGGYSERDVEAAVSNALNRSVASQATKTSGTKKPQATVPPQIVILALPTPGDSGAASTWANGHLIAGGSLVKIEDQPTSPTTAAVATPASAAPTTPTSVNAPKNTPNNITNPSSTQNPSLTHTTKAPSHLLSSIGPFHLGRTETLIASNTTVTEIHAPVPPSNVVHDTPLVVTHSNGSSIVTVSVVDPGGALSSHIPLQQPVTSVQMWKYGLVVNSLAKGTMLYPLMSAADLSPAIGGSPHTLQSPVLLATSVHSDGVFVADTTGIDTFSHQPAKGSQIITWNSTYSLAPPWNHKTLFSCQNNRHLSVTPAAQVILTTDKGIWMGDAARAKQTGGLVMMDWLPLDHVLHANLRQVHEKDGHYFVLTDANELYVFDTLNDLETASAANGNGSQLLNGQPWSWTCVRSLLRFN